MLCESFTSKKYSEEWKEESLGDKVRIAKYNFECKLDKIYRLIWEETFQNWIAIDW